MYGDWAQYNRRRRIAYEKRQPPPSIVVQCRECVGKQAACRNCVSLMDPWAIQHFGQLGRGVYCNTADDLKQFVS